MKHARFRAWNGGSMTTLDAHQRHLAGLARSVRAAIIVPVLFASALFVTGQPEVAGFAVFGTFAHLVMVKYDHAWKVRSVESAMLTALGAIAVGLGTLASAAMWLAAGGAAAIGFLTEFSTVAAPRIAVIRAPLLLAFMLAVAVPSSIDAMYPNLEGWLLSGMIAQPALLMLWIDIEGGDAAAHDGVLQEDRIKPPSSPDTWSIRNAFRTATAMALAILLTRLVKVEHSFWVVLGVLPVLNATSTSAGDTFWKAQAGTVIGFVLGGVLVTVTGDHQARYWLMLPFITFAAAYAASAIGLTSGQAGFTVFAIVLFCILLPLQKDVGIRRLEDIALGGAVGLVVSLVRRIDQPKST
jgi:Fusaric acid resistance protein-like